MKKDKLKELIIEKLKTAPIVQIACERVGIGRARYYRWRKEDPEFAEKANEAILEGLLLVNDMAESRLIAAIKEKNLNAIRFWLKHHHFAYGTRVEITAKLKRESEELSPEQEKVVRKALELASLTNNEATKKLLESKDAKQSNTAKRQDYTKDN